MVQEKGKGKAKRRDPRKGPSASSGKRPGKGTKKIAPTASAAKSPAATPTNDGAPSEPVRAGGTAKAAFSTGRAPRPPRPAAVKARALKAERAAASEAARARADTASPVAPRSNVRVQAPASVLEFEPVGTDDAPGASIDRAPLSTLTLGYIAGATPGRWADTWSARNPGRRLVLHPLSAAEQRTALDEAVDLALVRLPLDDADSTDGAHHGVHVIPLYEEVAFVVVSIESELGQLEEARFDDLAGQMLIVPEDNVLGELRIDGLVAPTFEPIATTEEAIATVAAGVGIVVVPQSLARLHRRKDVTSMPLLGGPTSAVALAWKAERESADLTSFVGVVRGRKATSSR